MDTNKTKCRFTKAMLLFITIISLLTSCGESDDQNVVAEAKAEIKSEQLSQVPSVAEPKKSKGILTTVEPTKGEAVSAKQVLINDEKSDVIVKKSGEIVKKEVKESGSVFVTSKYPPNITALDIYKAEQLDVIKAYQNADWISFNESRTARELVYNWARDQGSIERPYFGGPFDSLDMRETDFQKSREQYIKLIKGL